MKFSFRLLLGLMILPLLLGAAGSAQAGFVKVSFSDKVGLGCEYASDTAFGDYKSCSTDAFFYFLLVNESDENVKITLPSRVYANHTYLPVDPDGWYYKAVDGWTWENYADAKNGEKLTVDTYQSFILPAQTVYSVMGRMTKLPYTYTLVQDVLERTNNSDKIRFTLDVVFNNETKHLEGTFRSEGTVCGVVTPIAFEAGQSIRAGYLISDSKYRTCSMAYYFPIRNNDERYTTVLQLPQVISMNDVTWQIGCPTYYDDAQCTVSGFRHYAWAPQDSSSPDRLVDSSFHFCDQDKQYGDACYEEGDEWVVQVPPHTTYIIRGMVNDLCSGTQNKANPLTNSYVNVTMWVRTNALWDHEITDTITGTPRDTAMSGTNSVYSVSRYISRVEDADPTRASSQVDWEDTVSIGANIAGGDDILDIAETEPNTVNSNSTSLRLFRF